MDWAASYVLPTNSYGRFDISAAISYLYSFKQASAPGQALVEYVEQTVDGQGQDAYLRKKGRGQIGWTYKGYGAVIVGNFTNGFHDYDFNGNDRRVGSMMTWDVQLSYALSDEYGRYLKGTKLSVGAFNVFDRSPPVSLYGGNNPVNYPGFIYSSEGRMVYVSLSKKF